MIDAHLHIGTDDIFDDVDAIEEDILNVMDRNGISACCLYPANSNGSIEAEREKHQVVKDFFDKYPDRAYGICQVNPNYPDDVYFEEVKKHIDEGFKAVAVNPQIYGWDAMGKKGELVFLTASKLGIPVFIFSGIGLPLGQPIRYLPICQKYSDVKVVLVHAFKSVYGEQCDLVAELCPNVYYETSLSVNLRAVKKYSKKYPHRMIVGSALLNEVEHTVYMLKHSNLTEEEEYWAAEGTIKEVLGIEGGN